MKTFVDSPLHSEVSVVLANIIWVEDAEAGNHIVPCREDIENNDLLDYENNGKQPLNEEDTNSKAAERLPSASKKTELDFAPEISGNHVGKELGEFFGNSWANIGSFDDLDRIFSNNELDGLTDLGNLNALWSSPKELTNGEVKSSPAPLGSTNGELGDFGNSFSLIEPNSEYLKNDYPSVTSARGKTGISSFYSRHVSGRFVEERKSIADLSPVTEKKTAVSLTGKTAKSSRVTAEIVASPNYSADKDDWSKHQPQHGKIVDQVNLSGDIHDAWPSSVMNTPQFVRGCAPATVKNFLPVHSQEQQPNESRTVTYQHLANTYAAPYAYRNFPEQYPALKLPPQTDYLSSSEACQGDVTTARPLKMTPQEKIEKLRRRQQMRAMLAIQNQQLQLDHQEDQIMHMEKPDSEADENLNTLPCYDPVSSNKMDDLSSISGMDELPGEDTVLYHLQDIITILDVKMRMCIKDSLNRLARSAAQRHFSNDTSTINQSGSFDPGVAKEDMSSCHRTSGNANIETETNQVDRAVAHLLFHRPFKFAAKHAETPEFSISNTLSVEQETGASRWSSHLLGKSSEKDVISPSRSKRPFVDTCQEDVPTSISETEMKASPHMEQEMEHTD